MKLDKIKFASLLNMIGRFGVTLDRDDIADLDNLIDIDVQPIEIPGKANPADLDMLMNAIHEGEKIEAIKAYCTLTHTVLKEAKDAVEKYWNRDSKLKDAMLKSIDDQMNGVLIGNHTYTLNKFNNNELQIIRDFINSFY